MATATWKLLLTKPPGVFRILVLGDSFTVGANVRQEEAYPKVLEKRLQSVYGPRIQVVNAGVGGWDPFNTRSTLNITDDSSNLI